MRYDADYVTPGIVYVLVGGEVFVKELRDWNVFTYHFYTPLCSVSSVSTTTEITVVRLPVHRVIGSTGKHYRVACDEEDIPRMVAYIDIMENYNL